MQIYFVLKLNKLDFYVKLTIAMKFFKYKNNNNVTKKLEMINIKKFFLFKLLFILLILSSCFKHSYKEFKIPESINDDETIRILNNFNMISQIPRCTGNEGQMVKWLKNWVKKNNFLTLTDRAQNIVIYVPRQGRSTSTETIVMQAHMDMVCKKDNDSSHNFNKDPIKLVFNDEYLHSSKTTLGADNGIGMSTILAIAEDKTLNRPALELLFTASEENGLVGASKLDLDLISGKYLINIDTEWWGIFTSASTGFKVMEMAIPIEKQTLTKSDKLFSILVKSGKEKHFVHNIHEKHLNAIKVLSSILKYLNERLDISIVDFSAGTSPNIIPNEGKLVFKIDSLKQEKLQKAFEAYLRLNENKLRSIDIQLRIIFDDEPKDQYSDFVPSIYNQLIIGFLDKLKHGYEPKLSNNLALAALKGNKFYIGISQRSLFNKDLESYQDSVKDELKKMNGFLLNAYGYPAWEENINSKLIQKATRLFRQMYNKEPGIGPANAGLEPAYFAQKFPGIDIISLGPTILEGHSTNERVKIEDLARLYHFLTKLLEEL
ncbi:MAG: beta-Ala-His dipeptidase [Pseudomonadota bacterium]